MTSRAERRRQMADRRYPARKPGRLQRRGRRLLAGVVAIALLGGGVTYLGWNYGWGGAAGAGDVAPPFVLSSQDGRPVALADYLGQKPVALLFYMTYG